MEEKKTWLSYSGVAVLVVIVALLFIANGRPRNDIDFCRETFAGLISGRASVEKDIDWDNFKALHKDVGTTYSQLPNESLKAVYRRAFIAACALGYKYGKLGLREFSNWRIEEKDAEKVIITADYPRLNKVLIFTLSKVGGRKLVSVRWSDQK